MAEKIQAVRGMNDILPPDSSLWQQVEEVLRQSVASFGYSEIRMPVVERTSLFSRAIGEVTDVVEKEMYTFEDRSGDMLSLRPEGTAGCVRACLEHNLIYNQEQRLWYMGPMFRHERPQKGRYRQFHQIGVEAFGFDGPDIDAEIIMLSGLLWQRLDIAGSLRLQLNTLGTLQEREAYKKELVAFLEKHQESLDEDCKRRTHTNPLRVLDSKNEQVQELLKSAPVLRDFLGEGSRSHFEGLRRLLGEAGIGYEINDRLVRGLDYYNLTVFEWVTDALGAQGTVCGGGRYDGLVEQLGGSPCKAVGFGLGLERLVLLLETLQKISPRPEADIYVMASCQDAEVHQARIAARLREALPGVRVRNHCGGGGFKKQFKRADKSGARVGIVLGDEELAKGMVGVKDLREEGSAQATCSFEDALARIKTMLNI